MRIVIAVLVLLFGLRLLGSTLFNSLLAMRLDGLDYRVLPTLALLLFAIPICLARINANACGHESRIHKEDDAHGHGKPREDHHDA